jgi:hypothetical protein
LKVHQKEAKNEAKFVKRDSQTFRKFVESTYFSKDREDPYTHFYLKEARGKESINKMLQDENTKQRMTEDGSSDYNVVQAGEARR